MQNGTCSFMTYAQDALVFVKVCVCVSQTLSRFLSLNLTFFPLYIAVQRQQEASGEARYDKDSSFLSTIMQTFSQTMNGDI